MKQYTTSEQTTKLIELRFEKPKSIIDVWAHETEIDMEYEYEYAYSIGELIEMLPTDNNIGWNIRKHNSITNISKTQYSVIMDVNMFLSAYTTESENLIDALYDMILKLIEEGMI